MAYNSTTWSPESITKASASTVGTDNDLVLSGGLTVDTVQSNGGDITFDIAGDIILDASGEQVYFKKDGTSRLTFNLDSTPEIASNGAFTLSGSQITLDAIADIIIDADGDNIKFKAGGTEVAEFLATGGGRLRLYDDVTSSDFLNFNVLANGESYISTTDNDGTAGHIHLDPDGDLILEPGSNNVYVGSEAIMSLNASTGHITTAGTVNCTNALTISGLESSSAVLYMKADEADDNGDTWMFTSQTSDNKLTIHNNISGGHVEHLSITPHATVASSEVAIGGNLKVSGNIITFGNAELINNTTDNQIVIGTSASTNGICKITSQGTTSTQIASGGNADSTLKFLDGATGKWVMGYDYSDSGSFVMDTGGTLAAATKLKLDTSGNMTVAGQFACNGQTPSAAEDYTLADMGTRVRALNYDTSDAATVRKCLATLIDDLIAIGILQ